MSEDTVSRQAAIDAIVAQTIGYTVDEIKAECEENIFNENGYLGGLKDAIEAIEDMPSAQPETHEERTETHACDLIDRQAAIGAILAVTGNSSVRELYEHVQEHGLSEMWSGGVNAAIDIIIALTSAQPEPCGDAVSRNAIIKKLNTMDRYVSEELRLCDTDKKFPKNEVFIVDDVYEEIVEQLPSAQPEIIRCKDCQHKPYPSDNYDCNNSDCGFEILHRTE